MTESDHILKNKTYLRDYVIDVIKTAHSNFDVVTGILEYEKCDIKCIEDKQEYLKGLEYKLRIGYDEWAFIIINELLESLYINKRYIGSLMETLDHKNNLLVAEAKVYYSTKGRCTVAPITYCIIKKKFKLYKYKKIININEVNVYKLEKINVSNNLLIDKIENIKPVINPLNK